MRLWLPSPRTQVGAYHPPCFSNIDSPSYAHVYGGALKDNEQSASEIDAHATSCWDPGKLHPGEVKSVIRAGRHPYPTPLRLPFR